MISDVLQKKDQILSKITEHGVNLKDIQALLLTGSHYWGYDGQGSDIDIILVDKKWQDRKPIHFDEVSIEVLTHTEALKRNMEESNWKKFYFLQFCTYPLYGQIDRLEFKHSKIIDYFTSKKSSDVDVILDKPTKEGFHSVMSRIFYLNYAFNNLATFKLTDFQLCQQIDQETKAFLESQYTLLFKREENSKEDKKRLQDLCLTLEDKIKELQN